MTTIVHDPDQFSQDYADKFVYNDAVIKSGVDPDICRLNFQTAIGLPVYDLLFRDTDPTTNTSSGSTQAKRNYAKCENAIGYIVNGRFRQSNGPPIAFNIKKEKSKGFGKATTEKLEPRRYHQPIGKPLEILFARLTLPGVNARGFSIDAL